MDVKVENEDTERCLRDILILEGYELDIPKINGQNGVDIMAKKDNETLYIEVIGYPSNPQKRARDFFQNFFRTISRINEGATNCIFAIPKQAELGLPLRAKQYGIAWKRIGKAFPELNIWLIDVDNQKYEKTGWAEWLDK